MKIYLSLLFLLFFISGNTQIVNEKQKLAQLNKCKSTSCIMTKSFLLAEHFLETDNIELSQKWLNKTKDLLPPKAKDTMAVFVHSLQSELFYYDGIFQFGINEAEKAIAKAKNLKDSLLVADGYFFKGINQIEMNEWQEAQQSLLKARDFQPIKIRQKHLRSTIQNEHIYNNIAQLKFKINQADSAVWYNARAYQFALENKSKRGIPNVEQTFGQIYLAKNQLDSAVFYFEKSVQSAQNSQYYDIVLLNYGYLMQCHKKNQSVCNRWFQKGNLLMEERIINSTFQRYFYKIAQEVFKQTNQITQLALVQDKIISIDDETRLKGNLYIQNITEKYAKSETKLLTLEVEELKKQRKFTILQLVASLLSVIILSLVIIIIRRKNKIQQTLLQQKNEISKDLHDDIGSGLSSILIHADLLLKNEQTSEKQKVLASKINLTGKEISQRLNTFIWSLNTEHNTLQHFSEYVKHYGATLFDETPIKFFFHTTIEDNKTIKMNGQLRKNLFYALKEVFNNSLKHANATTIDLSMSLISSKQLQITIHDNGTGISKANEYGNGLKNIKNRVEQVKGIFTMKTQNGLITLIIIPL